MSMQKIQVLPLQLTNQIAAGEVVERPASVVKEIVENSLDANAKNISIYITAGGLKKIEIQDDGDGITQQDLPLAIARHATSKIFSLEDLSTIQSMGFRGEALASIASVSRFSIASSIGDDSGFQLDLQHSGSEPVIKPSSQNKGTTVIVTDLFYNTPARRKFLKTENTEFRRILALVKRIALSRFNISLQLWHNDKCVFKVQGIDKTEHITRRVSQILGDDFMSQTLAVDYSDTTQLRIWGWTGIPTLARNQTDKQYLFLNGRIIVDKVVSHAIRQAYADVLFNKLQPCFVLFLEVNALEIDFNVHPTKHEVRFHNPQRLHQFVFHSIATILAETKPTGEYNINRGNTTIKKMDLKGQTAPNAVQNTSEVRTEQHLKFASDEPLSAITAIDKPYSRATATQNTLQEGSTNSGSMPPLGYAIGQVNQLFILADTGDGLVIVDTHAAHERILYEKMKIAWHRGGDKQLRHSQQLAIPVQIQVSDTQISALEQHIEQLQKLGFDLQQTGPEFISVTAAPLIIPTREIEKLVLQTLTDLAECEASQHIENSINSILGNMACRAAIRGQKKLSHDEMSTILRDLEQTERSNQCNHGRPTYVHLDMKQLNSLFLRGQ